MAAEITLDICIRFTRSVAVRCAAGLLALSLTALPGVAQKKKAAEPPKAEPHILDQLDYSKIVWPNPPQITRVKFLNLFTGEKYEEQVQEKKKGKWMDRLAGITVGDNDGRPKPKFQLVTPYGVAVDSKGRLYVADSKVLAVFVFDTETGAVELIKNGTHARFGWITGLAIDDADRLFVADSKNRRVIVFDSKRQVEGSVSEGLVSPGGLALDNENRFLYVADADLDQVLVYDADPPFRLIRKLGTAGKKQTLTSAGDFARPTGVAVDKEGNLFVVDTLNTRVQVFDPDGEFIREFGKAGDGPGYFARPKGIAVDADGHVWVADSLQNRVQLFTPEGQLLMWIGERGLLPGQFSTPVGITIDSKNRVFVAEQYPGRVQGFQYFTNDEARAEKAKRDAEAAKKQGKPQATPAATAGAAKQP